MRRTRWTAALFLIPVVLAACASGPQHMVVPDYKDRLPKTIAVLPVLNETVNLKAPDVFRPIVSGKVSSKGYHVPSPAATDAKLLARDIRESGQVNSLTPQELATLLGVDALLYTTITEFSTTYLLAYASMTVAARFELRDARTGEKLWETEHRVKETKTALDTKTAGDILNFAVAQSYTPYCQKVVDVGFATMPNAAGSAAPAQKGCLAPG